MNRCKLAANEDARKPDTTNRNKPKNGNEAFCYALHDAVLQLHSMSLLGREQFEAEFKRIESLMDVFKKNMLNTGASSVDCHFPQR